MNYKYHVASPAAILGGLAAALGATALLVRDAFSTGWTVDHALMPVLVGLTVLSGHLFWQAVCQWRIFAAVGLAILAISGSGLTIYESMGRRAEIRDVKVATADDAEKQRLHLRKMLAEAEMILAGHRSALASECGSGKGKKCDGMSYTVSTWEHAVAGYEAKLQALPPPKPSDPKAERVATVLGFFTTITAASVKQAVASLEPFALPLFLEFGAIVFLSFGLSGQRQKAAIPVVDPPITTRRPQLPRGGSASKVAAERDLVTLLALGKPIPSQEWLSNRWRVSEGCASKWLKDFEKRGMITRAAVGKCKVVEAA